MQNRSPWALAGAQLEPEGQAQAAAGSTQKAGGGTQLNGMQPPTPGAAHELRYFSFASQRPPSGTAWHMGAGPAQQGWTHTWPLAHTASPQMNRAKSSATDASVAAGAPRSRTTPCDSS